MEHQIHFAGKSEVWPHAHICWVASGALASVHIEIKRISRDIKVHLFLFPPLLPILTLERTLCWHLRYAAPLCCPCQPSLLMEGLASLPFRHAQFLSVNWVSQANIYSGPKPLGRVFYKINSSSQ